MATSTNYGWSEPDNTSLVKDGALAMRTLGNAIDTSLWNSGYGQAGKNKIINGAMQVWQRGTSISFAASASGYCADRWQVGAGTNQAITISRQSTNDTTNLPFIQYCLRYQRNSGQTGTGDLPLVQSFETLNSVQMAGKSVTLSFYARKGANYSAASSALIVYLVSGTGTDQNRFIASYTGETFPVNSQTATLTTTWQRFTFTGTIPTNCTEIAPYIFWTPTGTAGTNDYYEITGVQLEVGSIVTPFQTASGNSYQGELAMCQRYYYRIAGVDGYLIATGQCLTTTIAIATIPFPVNMRIRPTALEQSGTANLYRVLNSVGTGLACSAVPTYGNGTLANAVVTYTVASGLVGGDATTTGFHSATEGYLGWSAEL